MEVLLVKLKFFFLLSFVFIITFSSHSADPEMRACWISRFEWPSTSENTCKSRISTMMQTLKDNNFNAVLFQVRGECDTLYPSPYEPWAPQFNWTDPGWDPLAYAIEEAHSRGIEFHAYINTHTMASTTPPSNTTPQHVYNLYGKPGSAENWQIHGSDGNPAEKTDAYYWLSPGVPQAEAWTRRAILHVVTTYDVDGVHFDRIRTPSADFSHDPISEARFAGSGNPDNEQWGDWMRSQITRQLRKIYGAINQVKPHVKISAAPFGICKKEPGGYQGTGTQSYYSWYQDSFGWMENHVLDAIFPMIYWDIGSAHPFEVLLADFLNHTGNRHIYSGCVTTRDYVAQIYETRSQGAQGSTIFSYNSINFSNIKSGPYSESAPVIEMSWKKNPISGIIVGYVKDPAGDPITDAKINLSGDSYNYLSSADGFYTILDISPGKYSISAFVEQLGEVDAETTITAGSVIQVDLIFNSSKGSLKLDKNIYHLGDEIKIRLMDSDLAGSPTVRISGESTSETEAEEIILAASNDTGIFTGNIKVQSGPIIHDNILQTKPGDTITFRYNDAFDGTGPSTSIVTATIDPYVVIYEEMLDTDPGWNTGANWEFGIPNGNAGDHGDPDPVSGYTGDNIYGYNLDGGYADDISEIHYLSSHAIDCSKGKSTLVNYYRWLGVEENTYDHAVFEVSNDGAIWQQIWENPASLINDSSWIFQEFDISVHADYRKTLYLRWGMGPTDEGWNYCGWNIDDVRVLQIPSSGMTLIIDNDKPGFVLNGSWSSSTQGNTYGPDKRFVAKGDGSNTASWIFNNLPPGEYNVEFWVNENDYASDAHYYIKHDNAATGGELIITSQNMREDGWHPLGDFSFTNGTAEIILTDLFEGEGLYVVADAIRLRSEIADSKSQAWFLY
jgi:uncharacterized lipoprotein YddW (UPF0748 family)